MAEFDQFSGRYTDDLNRLLGQVGANADEFARARADWLALEGAGRLRPPASLSILDVGCGVGSVTEYLTGRFQRVCGTDVSSGLLTEARQRIGGAEFRQGEVGQPLPFEDASFDITFCSCVMHHVSDADLPYFCAEMARVTRPGGLALTFEHNPINPVTRKIVRECELDKDVERLISSGYARRLFSAAGFQPLRVRYISFFPGFLRAFRWLERYLGWCPLGGQYYLVARKPTG